MTQSASKKEVIQSYHVTCVDTAVNWHQRWQSVSQRFSCVVPNTPRGFALNSQGMTAALLCGALPEKVKGDHRPWAQWDHNPVTFTPSLTNALFTVPQNLTASCPVPLGCWQCSGGFLTANAKRVFAVWPIFYLFFNHFPSAVCEQILQCGGCTSQGCCCQGRMLSLPSQLGLQPLMWVVSTCQSNTRINRSKASKLENHFITQHKNYSQWNTQNWN